MTLHELNHLDRPARAEQLRKCCGATRWVEQMLDIFPVADREALLDHADRIWNHLAPADYREAFTHHPKIGDLNALRVKFASTSAWAAGEQGSVAQAPDETLQALARGNTDYEQKFGYIFIVCATGKSAEQMLHLLQARLLNDADEEIRVAADEQRKITRLRLEKLLS
ncbi:2-oxo-4-hydroxy-4-carboxy-5-ureidoimidazoline decarboxylase [Hymenobacter gummosus]|uniref:2-oxo-4-hydroxy-4-carboxy-5-ureidoimidazoline decarboxylase n=1 Tax=Hymenobacter gummosus TaxID=1776032 RepID=A0A3S0INU4_9BACT|nr:2-oxo-4-hydroxy-4-carboxy-5-ureidoimidazoline decarboxylase [Hymenobacter gummosus]RTQ50059.1 2-oxo-4-hydroxy-4-carboxy-5-ureidoimidazoline decarboxylase [Hymenobacter gummosus]